MSASSSGTAAVAIVSVSTDVLSVSADSVLFDEHVVMKKSNADASRNNFITVGDVIKVQRNFLNRIVPKNGYDTLHEI